MKLRCSTEFPSDRASSGIGFAAPLMSSALPAGLQGFHTVGHPAALESMTGSPLMSLRPPSENSAPRAAAAFAPDRGRLLERRLLPWGLSPYSVSPSAAAASLMTGLSTPNRLRLQVFSTSWRLDPPRTCWPCFMPDPLLGFTLQSFAPPVQPFAVSGAVALLSLERVSEPPEILRASRRRRSAAPSLQAPMWTGRRNVLAFRALLRTRVRHFEPTV
jgi:hypothetical protein